MAYYLFQASYQIDQIKSMVGNPQDRSESARKLIEGLGGKLHHIFFSFGEYDLVAIIEVPDNATMVAGSMAVAAAGTTSACKTTPLLTMEEAMQAMEKSGIATGYKAPTG
jgi:uncharacterized protein with GYD domain